MMFDGPWNSRNFRLTGRIRYRRGDERVGLFSREPVMIALVEETYERYPVLGAETEARTERHWRDMRASDLSFAAPPSEENAA